MDLEPAALGLITRILMVLGINLGSLALFPRSRIGLLLGMSVAITIQTFLTGLGSALTGPLDLSQMLVLGPSTVAFGAVWYLWKFTPEGVR